MKKVIILLIAIAAIWGGVQGIYTAKQNPTPTAYELNGLSGQNMPAEKWLKLKNCNFNLLESVYFESAFGDGLANELYVPLKSKNDSIVALLYTKTTDWVNLYNLITSQTDPAKATEFYKKYKHIAIQDSINFKGLVRYGIDLDQKEWRQLAGSYPKLVKNFIIIDQNTKPSATFSYFMLVVGVFLLFCRGIKWFIKKEKTNNRKPN